MTKRLARLATLVLMACGGEPTDTKEPMSAPMYVAPEEPEVSYLCRAEADNVRDTKKKQAKPEPKKAGGYSYGKVHRANRQTQGLSNQIDGDTLTIYFATNKAELKGNDRKDGKTFLRPHPTGMGYIVEGYASHTGRAAFNDDLSARRVRAGVSLVNWATTYDPEFTTAAYGESKATQGATGDVLFRDQKVMITPDLGGGVVARSLDITGDADVYIVDQSASMTGPSWDQVVAYSFPKDARVFTFTDFSPKEDNYGVHCNEGAQLSTIAPDGSTPLYGATLEAISLAQNGQTITVLTDGGDTGDNNHTTPLDVIAAANAKNITVNTVGISHFSTQGDLERIARETGGDYYMVK